MPRRSVRVDPENVLKSATAIQATAANVVRGRTVFIFFFSISAKWIGMEYMKEYFTVAARPTQVSIRWKGERENVEIEANNNSTPYAVTLCIQRGSSRYLLRE